MYRVVGCRDCGALWIVAETPETTQCPRCGKRHRFGALHAFYESEDETAARRARAVLLAKRAGQADVAAETGAFDDIDLDAIGITDRAFLEASGIDATAAETAGERTANAPSKSVSPREAVLAALDALDRPTEAEIADHAAERDVTPPAVSSVLEKLHRAGEISESGGRYRRL